MLARNGLAHFLEACDRFINSHLNALAEHHGVCAGSDILHALMHDSLCKKGCGGGAVAGSIVGFGGYFFDYLCAHVLKRIFKGYFLCDGNTVVANNRSAEFLIKNNVAALRSECDFYSVRKLVDTGLKSSSGFIAIYNLFCHI